MHVFFRLLLNDDWDLDIPSDMTTTEAYRATLAHKVGILIVTDSADIFFLKLTYQNFEFNKRLLQLFLR